MKKECTCININKKLGACFKYGSNIVDSIWLDKGCFPIDTQVGDTGYLEYDHSSSGGWYIFIKDNSLKETIREELKDLGIDGRTELITDKLTKNNEKEKFLQSLNLNTTFQIGKKLVTGINFDYYNGGREYWNGLTDVIITTKIKYSNKIFIFGDESKDGFENIFFADDIIDLLTLALNYDFTSIYILALYPKNKKTKGGFLDFIDVEEDDLNSFIDFFNYI